MTLLKPIGVLSLGAILAIPAVAENNLILIPTPDERVFTAPEAAPEPLPPAAPLPQTSHADPFANSESFYDNSADLSGEFVGEIVSGPVYVDHAPIPLFTRVKYVDLREKHPHAVTKIVAVNNPCKGLRPCETCAEDCVYIEICVPPCDCNEDVRCRRGGDRVRYDYGKYKVDIRVRRGYIVVDYQK
ncbi:MAG: hypothetical protein R3C59_04610 [Planctomycetaceae bacterium]